MLFDWIDPRVTVARAEHAPATAPADSAVPENDNATHTGHVHAAAPWEFWLGTISAVVLLGVLAVAIFRPSLGKLGEPAGGAVCEDHAHETLILTVEGMTCSHCVETVTRALREQNGVESVDVRLEKKTAVVGGDELDPDALVRAVESVGYKARLGQS
jgi:copper chaperone CopZ